MKRDLKKWLKSAEALTYAGFDIDDTPNDYSICAALCDYPRSIGDPEKDYDDIIQYIWCMAQKQFLKDILDDIDDGIDQIFGDKAQVTNENARRVAEEAALKAWLYAKYKYLQRKNK